VDGGHDWIHTYRHLNVSVTDAHKVDILTQQGQGHWYSYTWEVYLYLPSGAFSFLKKQPRT
jgi:squalene cyclase